MNENENTTCKNLWDIAKAVWRGKFSILKTCIKKKKEKSQIHYISSHLRNVEKGKQKKPKESRKNKITD